MNIITITITTIISVVILSLTILFFKYKKTNTVSNNDTDNGVREFRMNSIRNFLTFKWVWYWTTEKYRKERTTRKKFNKLMNDSNDRKKKVKILRELRKNHEN